MTVTRRRFLASAAALVVAPSVLTQTLTFPTGVRAVLDLASTAEPFRGPDDGRVMIYSTPVWPSPWYAREQYPDGSEESDGALVRRIGRALALT